MKIIYYIFLPFIFSECSKPIIVEKQKTTEPKNIYSYVEQKVDSFRYELQSMAIEPDYIVAIQNDTIIIDNIAIKPFQTNDGLNINVNDHLIQTFKYQYFAKNSHKYLIFSKINLKKLG